MQLLAAWKAYHERSIGLRDLRVWLACHEVVARRTAARAGTLVRYRIEEVHALVGGVGGEHIRRSLRALANAGLVSWTELAVSLTSSLIADVNADPWWSTTLALVQNHRRIVPVPRPMLRWLARHGTRTLLATAFGHLLRCVYLRGKEVRGRGACKSSWVAEVFGVDVRNVKHARRKLAIIGWLRLLPTHQLRLNAHGQLCEIALDWSLGVTRETPPRPPLSTTGLPPPETNRTLSSRSKYQKPVEAQRGFGTGDRPACSAPTLVDIRPDDLANTKRLDALHEQACDRGLARTGEAGRLAFAALAARARRVGTVNACGLLAWLLRNQRWDTVTLADEDAARHQILRLETLATTSTSCSTAKIADLVENLLSQAGASKGSAHEHHGWTDSPVRRSGNSIFPPQQSFANANMACMHVHGIREHKSPEDVPAL